MQKKLRKNKPDSGIIKNFKWRWVIVERRSIRTNHRIRTAKIRLIGSDGKQIGIVGVDEGIKKAQEESLDLVEISPTANPPVCRIVDFGKYLYTLEKQEKEAKRKQHVIEIKEIKLSPNIDDHDYETKMRSAVTFLERGDKVKLTLMFRGREAARPELGRRVLARFAEDIADLAELEKSEGLERHRGIVMLFKPKPQIKKSTKVHTAVASSPTEKPKDAETQNEQSSS